MRNTEPNIHPVARQLREIETEIENTQAHLAKLQNRRVELRMERGHALANIIDENPEIQHTDLAALFRISEGTVRTFRKKRELMLAINSANRGEE